MNWIPVWESDDAALHRDLVIEHGFLERNSLQHLANPCRRVRIEDHLSAALKGAEPALGLLGRGWRNNLCDRFALACHQNWPARTLYLKKLRFYLSDTVR